MKKKIFIFLLLLFIPFILYGQKNTFESFERLTNVGLVVLDTSSLNSNYEQPIYNYLNNCGSSVTKIDTSRLDSATYDGTNNWNTLNLAIICFGTDSAGIDTSVTNGIGDIPVMVLEPYYWSSFGLPDSTGSASQDSFVVQGGNTFIDSIWTSADSAALYSANKNYFTMEAPTYSTNAFLLDIAKTDTVAVFDTLNTQPRIGFGLNKFSDLDSTSDEAGRTLFNRSIARLYGNNSDSLFKICGIVGNSGGGIYVDNKRGVQDFIELNGHEIDTLRADLCLTDTSKYASQGYDIFLFIASELSEEEADSALTVTMKRVMAISYWSHDYAAKVLRVGDYFSKNTIYVDDSDTIKVINNNHSITNIYNKNETMEVHTSTLDYRFYIVYNNQIMNVHPNATWLGRMNTSPGTYLNDNSGLIYRSYDNNGTFERKVGLFPFKPSKAADSLWSIFGRSLGWLGRSEPDRPTGLSATALSTDSLQLNWTDNYDSEDGYSIFIYDPDSTYFSHLSANDTRDTAYYFFPPNDQVIWDVAVVEGTDTLFSVDGKDTTYTLAESPQAPVLVGLDSTSLKYTIGGYNFQDEYSDSNYYVDPVWSVQSGSLDVEPTDFWLETLKNTDNIISTVYDHDENLYRDSYIRFDFKLCDSIYISNQTLRFHFSEDSSYLDNNGYLIEIDSTALTLEKAVSGSRTILDTYAWDRDFKWHTVKIEYDWTESPQDTSVNIIVNYDGVAIDTSNDKTFYPSDGDYFGFYANKSGIHIDNVFIYGVTPGANHPSTPFAIQETNSGNYINFSTNSLVGSPVWGYYSDFNSASGDTLSGLNSNQSYIFKLKAKNGQTK